MATMMMMGDDEYGGGCGGSWVQDRGKLGRQQLHNSGSASNHAHARLSKFPSLG